MPQLDRAGTRIFYEVTGDACGQPPLLLSHGFGASSAMWQPNRAALAAARQVITWDMRGHGRSDSPADPAEYTHAACVADMAALLDWLRWRSARSRSATDSHLPRTLSFM
jgi:pimeloyl-ACP methyl ester carboxylesterase